ncbi:MAG: lysine--tRNA ligase [Rickettsiales bacterium]|nr:lysine--tRNA ligase [Rickettsiales bacterium]
MHDFSQQKAWAFGEAAKLVERYKDAPPEKGYVLFETGYGPSGLPHIGTFGEVARTSMVRHAFETMSDIPTKLMCVSDDMDGMRKVPDNVPNQEMLEEHLQKPLTVVPDPFGTHDSFGAHNNAKLREFLDHYGFDYEFKSATELYKGGAFDDALLNALKRYDAIMKVMLPTLGEERQQTYSPFLPISPKTGRVLYVPMKAVDAEAGTITYIDEDGEEVSQGVTGGQCKLQWKPDFGMRWAALGVDFEMYGKDHQVNGKIYSAICRVLGGTPPEQYCYELFLDAKGEKISKSKGNGLSIDEWLTYATPESLSLFMFNSPRKAKRLHFDVIPKHVDEYLTWVSKYPEQEPAAQYDNPAWHIHAGDVPSIDTAGLSFGLLLNLASACNPEDKSILWGFISRYAEGAKPETHPTLDKLAEYAVKYYHDFVKPAKQYRSPTEAEAAALQELKSAVANLSDDTPADDIQTEVFTVGKNHGYENLREWFKALYEILLGQEQGPRMGSFIALYGRNETIALIDRAIAGEDLAA